MGRAFLKIQMDLSKRIIEIKKEQRQDKKKKKGLKSKLFIEHLQEEEMIPKIEMTKNSNHQIKDKIMEVKRMILKILILTFFNTLCNKKKEKREEAYNLPN